MKFYEKITATRVGSKNPINGRPWSCTDFFFPKRESGSIRFRAYPLVHAFVATRGGGCAAKERDSRARRAMRHAYKYKRSRSLALSCYDTRFTWRPLIEARPRSMLASLVRRSPVYSVYAFDVYCVRVRDVPACVQFDNESESKGK